MLSTERKLWFLEWLRYSEEAGRIFEEMQVLIRDFPDSSWSIQTEALRKLIEAYERYEKRWEGKE